MEDPLTVAAERVEQRAGGAAEEPGASGRG
jgi:hypothetical protein